VFLGFLKFETSSLVLDSCNSLCGLCFISLIDGMMVFPDD
jgi:hypothetical protein